MNVVAISRCKNEADIVEPWVRHTLAHVDRLLVSENDSTDETPEILQALVNEGLPLTVIKEATIGDYQASVFTRMMREVAPAADWIVPLDTDEFLETDAETNGSAPRFADLLVRSPAKVRSLRWQTMAWSSVSSPSLNPAIDMRHRLAEETYYQKVSVPKTVAMAKTLSTGSHFMLPDGDQGEPVAGARIVHFPLRSVDQYKLKATLAYLQSCCVPGWDRAHGFQFGELPNVDKITASTLEHYSRRYASQKPPGWEPQTIYAPLDYRGGELRYTKPAERFMPTLLRFAEKLALGIAQRDTAGHSFAVNR